MRKRYAAFILAFVMAAGALAGCKSGALQTPATPAPQAQTQAQAQAQAQPQPEAAPVSLTVSGSWPDCRAIEEVGREFSAIYPNCTVEYECIQNYYDSVEKRMTGEDMVDLFFTSNIQNDSPLLPYAAELKSCAQLDLSDTFDGLIENFAFRGEDKGPARLYAVPLGAEMRGLYINKTLLDSLGIAIPADQASLLSACKTLKENGYIPMQGNPADFAQTLLYPWICNIIANADDPKAAHDRVNAREAGISDMFFEPYSLLYSMLENGYYDYKRSQTELDLSNDTSDEAYARYFLNIVKDGDSWKKGDDIGVTAFLPSPISMKRVVEKTKEDYHSDIEYVFVPAPVGPEGGFVYLSPAHGIAANKNSADLEWSIKFLDFLFKEKNNRAFAESFNIIPNTKEAAAYINALYDIPENRVSQLGQVTFDYGFYEIIQKSLIETSKGNNPKYMKKNSDGSLSLYPLEYYMSRLEESFKKDGK